MAQLIIRKALTPAAATDGRTLVNTILRVIGGLLMLVMVAGCSKYVEWNKPRARRDATPPPDHSYCWRQAEQRAVEQYAREGASRDQAPYSAYGRSALTGDLRRMDAQRLREELYENCLTLRAQIRDAEKAAAEKAAAQTTPAAGPAVEEVVVEDTASGGATDESFEDIIKPPPMQ